MISRTSKATDSSLRSCALFSAVLFLSMALLVGGLERTADAWPGAAVPIPPSGGSILESPWIGVMDVDDNSTVDGPRMVFESGDGDMRAPYLLIEEDPKDGWFADDFVALADGVVRASVVEKAISDSQRDWMGRSVSVHGADGEVCRGEVRQLFGLVRPGEAYRHVVAPGSDPATGQPRDGQRPPRKVWNQLSASPKLVGKIAWEDDCEIGEPVWAHKAGESASPIATGEAPESINSQVVELFRKTPEYEDIQADYVEYWDAPAETWSNHRGAKPDVAYYDTSTDGISLALVSSQFGPGCGNFGANLWKLYAVYDWGEGPQFVELDGGHYVDPVAVVEYGDEQLALIYDDIGGNKDRHLVRDVAGVDPVEQSFMQFAISCRC